MIYNRAGAQYTCCGVTYTIGGRVYANNESIYEGLYGVIREIRTGEDMETDNDTPDFYCDFIPPVVSDERKIIENRFTRFWRTEKRLEDLDLEMVIMDPYMLVVLDPPKNAQSLEIFLVREDWAIDDDYGTSTQIVADYHMAQFHFNNLIFQEMIDGCIQKWKHRKDLETDTHKDFYECWLHDEYYENHYKVTIERAELSLPGLLFQSFGKACLDQSHLEDFVSQVEQWDEVACLTEDQFHKFTSNRNIPKRIETHLSKNDGYWERYWKSVSECAHSLLRVFLLQISKPECYVPVKDNSYPLCEGKGMKSCEDCYVYKDYDKGNGRIN